MRRDEARAELDEYRTNVFPGYETAINVYLERFNADFRLGNINAHNTRGGPTCSYNVVINNVPVAVAGGDTQPGMPSFRNTLSAGDRNTLALAFFFASLDSDPELATKVIIIDDPNSSLDEHRALTSVQQIRHIAQRVEQLIVLSHNKSFLCSIWSGLDRTTRSAIQIQRDGDGSTITTWDVDQNSVTEYDRQHELLRNYLTAGEGSTREVAGAIRPVLEAYLRVARPEHYPPGRLLGPFRELCVQYVGTPNEILNTTDTAELDALVEYANRFHHETNPAWQTATINETELGGFVRRTLNFTCR